MSETRRRLHRYLGVAALAFSLMLWLATITALAIGDAAFIAATKLSVLFTIGFQISALLAVAITGNLMAIHRRREAFVRTKARRFNVAAALTMVILLPSSVYLAMLAQTERFGPVWKLVQAAELVAGAAVIVLLWLNLRDGLAKARQRKRP